MTAIDELFSRARLIDHPSRPEDPYDRISGAGGLVAGESGASSADLLSEAANQDLLALCEALVSRTPTSALSGFVTEQLPDPDGARVLGCILQLAESEDGARSWVAVRLRSRRQGRVLLPVSAPPVPRRERRRSLVVRADTDGQLPGPIHAGEGIRPWPEGIAGILDRTGDGMERRHQHAYRAAGVPPAPPPQWPPPLRGSRRPDAVPPHSRRGRLRPR